MSGHLTPPERELERLIAAQQADDKPYITDPVAHASLDKVVFPKQGTPVTVGDAFGVDEDGTVLNFLPLSARRTRMSDIRHGTATGYGYHRCRCEECRKANAKAMKAWRARIFLPWSMLRPR